VDNYQRVCGICGKEFRTKYKNKNICSFECREVSTRKAGIASNMRVKNSLKPKPCKICGYDLTTDVHHEGHKTYVLCPNHHALITRGIQTLKELLDTCV
jgi:hypothetical protein